MRGEPEKTAGARGGDTSVVYIAARLVYSGLQAQPFCCNLSPLGYEQPLSWPDPMRIGIYKYGHQVWARPH